MKILHAIIFGLTLSSAIAQVNDDKFATTVLFPERVTRKFVKPVTFSFVGDAMSARPEIEKHIAEFNTICAGLPVQIAIVADGNEQADIVFKSERGNIMRLKHDFSVNSKSEINRATITFEQNMTFDQLGGYYLRRMLHHGLLQALGFAQCDPSVRPDSMWAVLGASGEVPMSLTQIDRDLIRFFYEKVPAGSTKSDVRKLVKKEK